MEKPLHVFCCYARTDQSYLLELNKRLIPLQRDGLIVVHADINISPGEDWEQKIHHYLNTAHIILLLVSSDFIASEYCYSNEMMRALERHDAGDARVIPIILRPVDLRHVPFGKIQSLPTDAKPITNWADRDDAFLSVATGIEEVVQSLINVLEQAASKEGDIPDEIDPSSQPQGKEQESYIGSYQHRMETFVRQQDEFDLALVKAMPGKGSYTPTYIQAKNKKEIDRVLSSLADACEACDLRWFSGYQWGNAYPIKRLAEEVWLIQYDECKIIDLWIYRHPTLERQYVLLHLAPQVPFGLDSDNANSDREEAGYYKGRYVTRSEYDDGYAEIDEEVIELQGVELRSRNLRGDFKVLTPVYSVYNERANRQQTDEVYQALRATGKIDQSLLQPLEWLVRPQWMEW